MRWENEKDNLESQYGTSRIVTKFLYFPKKLICSPKDGNYVQWRWLERTSIKQMCIRGTFAVKDGYTYYWKDLNWVD